MTPCFTCQHDGSDTVGPALHGRLHQRGEPVTVPPLHVQAREVVEQIAGDEDVTCGPERKPTDKVCACLQHGFGWFLLFLTIN